MNDPRSFRPTPELCDAISPHPGAAPLTFDPKQRSLMGSLKMLRYQRRCALYWMFLVLISVPARGPAAEEAPWPDPKRYRAVIQTWAAGVPGPSRAVVGIGSSSMRFWSTSDRFAKAFEPLTTINRGFGGSVMNDVAYFLDPAVLDLEPRAVMIYEGDNDIARGISQAAILSSLQGIIEQLHFRDPQIRVYVFSIKPSLARMSLWASMQAVNQSFKSLAEGNDRVFYVDVATAMLNDNGRPDPDLFIDYEKTAELDNGKNYPREGVPMAFATLFSIEALLWGDYSFLIDRYGTLRVGYVDMIFLFAFSFFQLAVSGVIDPIMIVWGLLSSFTISTLLFYELVVLDLSFY